MELRIQDSVISWVKVPLKYVFNNLILADKNQHRGHFWSSLDFLHMQNHTFHLQANNFRHVLTKFHRKITVTSCVQGFFSAFLHSFAISTSLTANYITEVHSRFHSKKKKKEAARRAGWYGTGIMLYNSNHHEMSGF